MNSVLLDTHVLLWWLQGGENLSSRARSLILNPAIDVLVSAASAWEIAIKHEAGKLEAAWLVAHFHSAMEEHRFVELPISAAHALRAGILKAPHKDPFDRVLVAQAQIENVPLVSNDNVLDEFSVQRVW